MIPKKSNIFATVLKHCFLRLVTYIQSNPSTLKQSKVGFSKKQQQKITYIRTLGTLGTLGFWEDVVGIEVVAPKGSGAPCLMS